MVRYLKFSAVIVVFCNGFSFQFVRVVDILSPTSYHGQEDSDSALVVSPLPTSTSMLSPLTEGVEQDGFPSSDVSSRPRSTVHDAPRTPRRRIASPLPLSPLKGFVAPVTSPVSSLSFAIPLSSSRERSTSPSPATSSTSPNSELPPSPLLYKEDNGPLPAHLSTSSTSASPHVPLAGLGFPHVTVERGRPLRKHYAALSRSPSPSVQPRTPLDTGFSATFNEGQGNTTRRSSGSGGSGTRARSRAMESLESLQEKDSSRGRSKYVRLRPPGDVLSSFESGIEIMSRSDSGSSDAVVGMEHDRIRRPLGMDTVNELEGWAGARAPMADSKMGSGDSVAGTTAYDRLFSPERSVISPERSGGTLDTDASPLSSGRSASPRHHHSFSSGFGFFKVERDKGSRRGLGDDGATTVKGNWASKGKDLEADRNLDINGIVRSRRAGSTPPTSVYFAKDSHIHSLHHLRPQYAHPHPTTHHWTHSHTPVFLGSNHPQKRDHFGLGLATTPMPLTPAGIHSGQHTPVAAMKSAPAHAVTVKVPVWGKGIGVSGMRSRSLGPL